MNLKPLSPTPPRHPESRGRRVRLQAISLVAAATATAGLVAFALLSGWWSPAPTDEAPLVALDKQTSPHAAPNPRTAQPATPEPLPQPQPLDADPEPPEAFGPTPTHTEPVISDSEQLTFNGRPIRPVRTVRMLTTAYSPDAQSCGIWADGITASGYSVYTNGMKLVAADTRILPFGSLVAIPGYNGGRPVPVLDRGGAIKGNRLDVLYPTHQRALQWGAQRLDVVIYEYAD